MSLRGDHPRIRGEHQTNPTARLGGQGSSPHTRGAPPGTGDVLPRPGIIPAYAGSTGRATRTGRWSGDHPRIRGEHWAQATGETNVDGSSPHTRGAPRIPPRSPPPRGIIPAYAGSTHTRMSRLRADPPFSAEPDHPRIRGEHMALRNRRWNVAGSSPHTRGARNRGSSSRSPVWDHPRIRGEHMPRMNPEEKGTGSSPHTRGARPRRCAGRSPDGIIPAYAGSTHPLGFALQTGADHPRIRGEHPAIGRRSGGPRGSSPHTRGAQVVVGPVTTLLGIIPAYAGSTIDIAQQFGVSPDHPRIRGEHRDSIAWLFGQGGSSPHTRGAPRG